MGKCGRLDSGCLLVRKGLIRYVHHILPIWRSVKLIGYGHPLLAKPAGIGRTALMIGVANRGVVTLCCALADVV